MSVTETQQTITASTQRAAIIGQPLTKERLRLFNTKTSAGSRATTTAHKNGFPRTLDEVLERPASAPIAAPNALKLNSTVPCKNAESDDEDECDPPFSRQQKTSASDDSIATLVHKFINSTTTLTAFDENSSSITTQAQPRQRKMSISAPTSPQGNASDSPSRPTLTRKIKSSLKLPSLTRSKSLPQVQKTVRFSANLTKVKTFDEHAKPSSISTDNSPECSPGLHDEYSYSRHNKASFDLDGWCSNSSSSSSDSSDDDDYFSFKPLAQKSMWSLKCLNFNLMSFHQGSNSTSPVVLNNLCLSNKNSSLVGSVDVANYAFEKYVEIKYTIDSWKSVFLVTGTYDRSLSNNVDRFNFEINLNKSLLLGNRDLSSLSSSSSSSSSKNKIVKIELCIKYVAGGSQIFYDNNNSANYQLELINHSIKSSTSRHKRSPSIASSLSSPSSFASRQFSGGFSVRRPTISASTYSRNNFKVSSASASQGKKPEGTQTTGRYFSDDRDYFNHDASLYTKTPVPTTLSARPALNSFNTINTFQPQAFTVKPQTIGGASQHIDKLTLSWSLSGPVLSPSSSSPSPSPSPESPNSSVCSTPCIASPSSDENDAKPSKPVSLGKSLEQKRKPDNSNNNNYNSGGSYGDFIKKYCFYKSNPVDRFAVTSN